MNEDARSPGAGSTPGPLSQQPPVLDTSDPGKWKIKFHFFLNLRKLKFIRAKKN